jgi:dienelactone hydrolase
LAEPLASTSSQQAVKQDSAAVNPELQRAVDRLTGYRRFRFLESVLDKSKSAWIKLAIGAAAGGIVGLRMLAREQGNAPVPLQTRLLMAAFSVLIGVFAASLLVAYDFVRDRKREGKSVPFALRLYFGYTWISAGAWAATICVAIVGYAVWLDMSLKRGRPARAENLAGAGSAEQQSLFQSRAGFVTRLIPSGFQASGPAPEPPPEHFRLIRYKSEVGDLVAYVTPDPGDGQRHAAVLWAHGGFGGVGDTFWQPAVWRNDQSARAFRDAGLVLMCPSWRGENDNPGDFELFYGEVSDVLAAADYLASLPYVDPQRIYLAGHSTGGTLALLAATATDRFRAVFSFGGAPDMERSIADGGYDDYLPFDKNAPQEAALRSATRFVHAIKSPTFYFEGANSGYCSDAIRMEIRAKQTATPFTVAIIERGDHFNILQCLTSHLASLIGKDSGAECNIKISQHEANRLFHRAYADYLQRRSAFAKDMPIIELTPAAIAKVREVMQSESLDPVRTGLLIDHKSDGWQLSFQRIRPGLGFATLEQDGLRIQVPAASVEFVRGHVVHFNASDAGFDFIDRAGELAENPQ